VALTEPLADAGHVEFVLACLARHLGEALVGFVDYTVANVAILNTVNLLLYVSLPSEDSRNDVSILELNDLPDSQDPLPELLLRYLKLLADINLYQLERIIGRDLYLESHLDLALLEIGNDFFG